MPQLISLQIGSPEERVSSLTDGAEAIWTSGIYKRPVSERLGLEHLGLRGDSQADLKNHGGKDKAVCCYSGEHYADWRSSLGLTDEQFSYGAFGENFTLEGMTENTVCVGDIYSVGTARVQISQPRMPCYKLGRRWELPNFPHAVKDSGKTGYYLRVLDLGNVGAGDAVMLLERPLPEWTVSRVNDAMYVSKEDVQLADILGRLPLLAEAWRSLFRRRAGLIRYRQRAV